MLTTDQCRAARALLKWTQKDLSDRTNISQVSIRFFETGKNDMRMNNQRLLRLTFENAGLVFIDENGGGAGVRFAKPEQEKSDE